MPSLPPLVTIFCARSRRSQQTTENDASFLKTCKTAVIKFLTPSCFTNSRREEEVEQMIRDEEHEQELTNVMQQSESMANREENRNFVRGDMVEKSGVTITEHDMRVMAEELQPGCTGSKRFDVTEKNAESVNGKRAACKRGGKNIVQRESSDSVDNFGIEDIENLAEEQRDKPKSLETRTAPKNSQVGQNETPKLCILCFLKQNTQKNGRNEDARHNLNSCFRQESTEKGTVENMAGPSDAKSMHPETPILANMPPPAIQATKSIAKIWGVNEGWGPPPTIINDATPPQPCHTTLKSQLIPAPALNKGWGPPPTQKRKASSSQFPLAIRKSEVLLFSGASRASEDLRG